MLLGRTTTRTTTTQGGDAPGNSGNTPGHDHDTPGNSGTAPGQDDRRGRSDDSPGNSGNAPGQNKDEDDDEEGGGPGSSGNAPGHDDDSPGNSGNCPRSQQGQQSGMRVTRQARAGGAASLGQRAPRLVFRVALFSALTLGIGAATLLVFIRHFERTRAEETATLHASVAAQAVVDRLRPSDLAGPISKARREELDRILTARVLDEGTPASAIATADGRLVSATEVAGAGSAPLTRELLGTALGGTVASELITTEVKGASTKVFRAYAPFRLEDGTAGVLVVDKDYGPIAAAARRAAITVAVVLEGVLLALWLCLFPIMRSVTRRMNRQLDTIAHQALHDDLTGLANRTQFGQRLDEALEAEVGEEKALTVFFIDLERFKEVNDALGHDWGNELLTVVAARLDDVVGEGELVARLGGDEFGVLSERATDEAPRLRSPNGSAARSPFLARSPACRSRSRGASASPSRRSTGRRETSSSAARTSRCTQRSASAHRRSSRPGSTTTRRSALR